MARTAYSVRVDGQERTRIGIEGATVAVLDGEGGWASTPIAYRGDAHDAADRVIAWERGQGGEMVGGDEDWDLVVVPE